MSRRKDNRHNILIRINILTNWFLSSELCFLIDLFNSAMWATVIHLAMWERLIIVGLTVCTSGISKSCAIMYTVVGVGEGHPTDFPKVGMAPWSHCLTLYPGGHQDSILLWVVDVV